MADDPVEEGLRKTEAELEAFAAELEASISPDAIPEPPARVDDPIGRAAAELLGGVLRTGLQALLERPRQPSKPRWKFTTSSQAVAAPLTATTAPAPAVALGESGKPDASPPEPASRPHVEEAPTLGLPGLSFVGHLDEKPRAQGSTRFPKEFLEAHEQRLDIDRTEPLSRPKLSGPIIGSSES